MGMKINLENLEESWMYQAMKDPKAALFVIGNALIDKEAEITSSEKRLKNYYVGLVLLLLMLVVVWALPKIYITIRVLSTFVSMLFVSGWIKLILMVKKNIEILNKQQYALFDLKRKFLFPDLKYMDPKGSIIIAEGIIG